LSICFDLRSQIEELINGIPQYPDAHSELEAMITRQVDIRNYDHQIAKEYLT
jgi:hypothetical protein